MECFYPSINSCGSVVTAGQERWKTIHIPGVRLQPIHEKFHVSMKFKKPADHENKTKKKKKKTSRSKPRRSSSSSKSRSKSKSKTMSVSQQQQQQQRQQQLSSDENGLRAKYGFTKRIGSAYRRSDASIITDGNTTVADHDHHDHEDERSVPGTVTCSTGSASSTTSSSAGEHMDDCTGSMASMTLQDDTITKNSFVTRDDARDDVTTRTVDNASVTTDNVAMKGGFGWFQPTLNRAFMKKVVAGGDVPASPSNSSVVAVKKSIKSKFDYIRTAQRFSTNNYADPPADQSIRTSHSVKADDAAAAVAAPAATANGARNRPIDNRTQQQRRSELAKQILQRRTITAADHHESTANANHLSRVDP